MIQARGLTRNFTSKTGKNHTTVPAVAGVDLDVSAGEIIGFLGPNGAGKTTTLRMLTTLLSPSSGTAHVAGFDVAKHPQEVRRRIGYVSQAGGVSSSARAGEEVCDHAQLYGINRKTATTRAHELFTALDLDGLWDRQPRTFSGGQRRRLNIAMGLINRPELVFLDEPTTGLDPQARANLWDHIRTIRDQHGVTVFLTTHYLDEADALADRIIIIDHGRIVAADTPQSLKAHVAGDLVELTVAPEDLNHTRTELAQFAPDATHTSNTVSGRLIQSPRKLPILLDRLAQKGVTLTGLQVRQPTLDDVFFHHTGRSLRDGEATQPAPEPIHEKVTS